MESNYEEQNVSEIEERRPREIKERALRVVILKEWAKRLSQAAKLIEAEADTAFDPSAREGKYGQGSDNRPIKRGVGLLSPNFRVPLEGEAFLGVQVPLRDLERFSEDPKAFIETLNKHLFTYEKDSSPNEGTDAKARLENDRLIIERVKDNG